MFFSQNTSKPFEWINKLNIEDRHWARGYLLKKGLNIYGSDFEPSYEKQWPDDAIHREIDQKTRNAWRQRKARNVRSGKKAYNFVLTNDSKRKLDKISESMHCSITEALENVIEQESKRKDEHKAALKRMKEKIQETKKELEQENKSTEAALKQLINQLQKELNYSLLNLALKNLNVKNPATVHTPLEALKDKVIPDFNALRLKSISGMGLVSVGLSAQPIDTEELWSQLIEAREA